VDGGPHLCQVIAVIEIIDSEQVTDPDKDELAIAHDKIANLEIALVSARRIGMAIGILMARHGLTDDQAFERLRQVSQQHHHKLRDIAEQVIFTGALDD
jgi:AmiR/NasT family two-component response regulator